ncbi:Phox domain-containing protein [Tieghemostelium lacteum]|uniref:Phox domain-containing protein n=1 Tax=Tieghemostelium lacteum TaxID=361077 RepID=A0A151ZC40_TIELA|nr:Phox domain-containing protein [Tieghemostelium lacteum]|eukprot:KYQ91510.1 Phox domain-containing protein [Tieghemostelium lacteum]
MQQQQQLEIEIEKLKRELDSYKKLLHNESSKALELEQENIRLKLSIQQLEDDNKTLTEKLQQEQSANSQQQNNSINGNSQLKTLSSQVASITIPKKISGIEKGSSRTYTAYAVDVESVDGQKYTIARRYKQFTLLHTQLVRIFGEHDLPSLPGKKNGLYFSSDDHTEKRRTDLQDYLQTILRNPKTSSSLVFYQFLKRDEQSSPIGH